MMKKRDLDPGLADEIKKLDEMLSRIAALRERLILRMAQVEEWLAAHDEHGNTDPKMEEE